MKTKNKIKFKVCLINYEGGKKGLNDCLITKVQLHRYPAIIIIIIGILNKIKILGTKKPLGFQEIEFKRLT